MAEGNTELKTLYFGNPFEKLKEQTGDVITRWSQRAATPYGKEHAEEVIQLSRQHTETTLRLVKQRAQEMGIKTVVIATTTGYAAVKAVEILDGIKVIAVTHPTGHHGANKQELTDENRKIIESKGGTVLTCAMALSSPPNIIPGMPWVGGIIASTLRFFGEGMKVTVEIVLEAADAGLVRTDEEVISVAGTGRGSDTAILLRPVNSKDLSRLRIREILCKPHF
ncbi:MAG: pyruvate kinase alpha/beta domain-containing protein [Chloroflexota bacterium]